MDKHSNGSTHVDVSTITAAVQSALEDFLATRYADVDAIGKPVSAAADRLRDFALSGGKRIRPLYAWAGFVGAGATPEKAREDPDAVLRSISSLELIQACALIHDDIIDASDTRRSNPTVHRAVEADHRDQQFLGDSAQFGRNAAILIGDLALVWAEDMWRYSGLSSDALQRASQPWRAMRTDVLGGQLLDIALEAIGDESVQMANNVNRYKTASYTIEQPLHLGATLGGASDETIRAFRGYGRDIGIAFQLRDDMLGVFGDEAVTGKPAGDDLREGKRTVLLASALNRLDSSNPSAAQRLRAGVGHTSDAEEIADLADIIRSSGAVEDVEKRIAELTASGLAYIDGAEVDNNVVETLRDLAIRATERRA